MEKVERVYVPVSVEERLPEYENSYFVIYNNDFRKIGHHCFSDDVFYCGKGTKVTHWLEEKMLSDLLPKSGEQPGKPESWKDIVEVFEKWSKDQWQRTLPRELVKEWVVNVVQPLQEELEERESEIENLQEETENRIQALQKQLNRERDEALRLSTRKDAEMKDYVKEAAGVLFKQSAEIERYSQLHRKLEWELEGANAEIERLRDENIKLQRSIENVKETFREIS